MIAIKSKIETMEEDITKMEENIILMKKRFKVLQAFNIAFPGFEFVGDRLEVSFDQFVEMAPLDKYKNVVSDDNNGRSLVYSDNIIRAEFQLENYDETIPDYESSGPDMKYFYDMYNGLRRNKLMVGTLREDSIYFRFCKVHRRSYRVQKNGWYEILQKLWS